jgi:hypothetical protein
VCEGCITLLHCTLAKDRRIISVEKKRMQVHSDNYKYTTSTTTVSTNSTDMRVLVTTSIAVSAVV